MKHSILLYGLILLLTLNSCGVISNSSNELTSGYYTQRTEGKRQQVYVDVDEEQLGIHRLSDGTAESPTVYHPEEEVTEAETIAALWQHSFDLDLLTIPLKYRPAQQGVPAQLNSDLNGAVYLGYRMDRYKPHYHDTPTGNSFLETTHFGFSFGYFTGLGNTAMTPTTTNNHIDLEYDGVVWLNGVAAIVGVNNFTVGFSVGLDSLLDENSSYWIYQTKPWIGLAVGLNLN